MTSTNHEQLVLTTLRKKQRPMSAYELLQSLHGTKVKAAVQVYRATEKLLKRGDIHRLESLNAFVACHCDHGDRQKGAPGFMLCTCCGDVKEFNAAKTVSAANREIDGFRIQDINVEVKGLCTHCQVENHTHGRQA